MKPRTKSCITLCPTNNKNYSWLLYCLETKRVVTRDQWTVMNIDDNVINVINDISKNKDQYINKNPIITYKGKIINGNSNDNDNNQQQNFINSSDDEYKLIRTIPNLNEYSQDSNYQQQSGDTVISGGRHIIRNKNFHDPDNEEMIDDNDTDDNSNNNNDDNQSINSSTDSSTDTSETASDSEDEGEEKKTDYFQPTIIESRLRTNRQPNPLYMDAMNLSIKEAIDEDEVQATRAINDELQQMIDKKVWHPVHRKDIDENDQIIPSKIFLKKKYNQSGEIVKWKGRLVAGGHRQNQEKGSNNSSPTAHLQSIFILSLIAAKESRHVCTVDIAGAYLHANMQRNIYMRLNKDLTEILIRQFPEYSNFLEPNKTLIVKLDKALYGCVESGKLWYQNISKFLISIGFKQTTTDECIFQKLVNEESIHIGIYVDDFIITSTNMLLIKEVQQQLKEKYNDITVNEGKIHTYLGMTLDFSINGEVNIGMEKYIKDILEDKKITTFLKYPADLNLYKLRNLPLLSKEMQDTLHSDVAKLLYLSTRIRPDIALAVNYLCTRVNRYNKDDVNKYYNILKYLNNTKKFKLKLKCNGDYNINTYADSSFGICPETRLSQTGIIIYIGEAPILFKSTKQRLVTKSSTEAELVACSDAISPTYYIKNLLKELGIEVKSINLYQDNMSTIHLINNNRPTSQRTRHIDIRYFFLRDEKMRKEINLKHMPTDQMIADLLTKPIVGEQFRKLNEKLMNQVNN